DDHVADRVARPLVDHERQVDFPWTISRPGHRRYFDLEEALLLVIVHELLPVLIEQVAMILSEESQDWLARGDMGPKRGGRGELAADEMNPTDLDLGSLEDLDHDAGVAWIGTFDQVNLGQVVSLLLVEAQDLA